MRREEVVSVAGVHSVQSRKNECRFSSNVVNSDQCEQMFFNKKIKILFLMIFLDKKKLQSKMLVFFCFSPFFFTLSFSLVFFVLAFLFICKRFFTFGQVERDT